MAHGLGDAPVMGTIVVVPIHAILAAVAEVVRMHCSRLQLGEAWVGCIVEVGHGGHWVHGSGHVGG